MEDVLRHLRFTEVPGSPELTMYDTHVRDSRGQTIIGYSLMVDGNVMFEGEDFAGSPMHADDSDACVRALLCFLTLRPGDTDAGYFAEYTEDQRAWCASGGCEELSWYAEDDSPLPTDIE